MSEPAPALPISSREPDSLEAELLGIVSHELRTPLAAIKGYATTLLRHEHRLPLAERREFLEAIGHASRRLEVVINRLLEMSELDAGTMHLEWFPVDIARLVDEAVLSMRERTASEAGCLPVGQRLQRKGQFTFVITHEPRAGEGATSLQEPLLVVGDARRLRHVLDHILENAVKYSPVGGAITVTLRTRTAAQCTDADEPTVSTPLDRVKPLVEIEIRDPGMGIPEEHLDRVFERFHRIDRRLAREAEGMGLGLAIARRIVELHGGTIWAESMSGNGSVFHIRFPLATTAEANALDYSG